MIGFHHSKAVPGCETCWNQQQRSCQLSYWRVDGALVGPWFGLGRRWQWQVKGHFQHFGSFNSILLSGERRTIFFPISTISTELIGPLSRLRGISETSYSHTRLYTTCSPPWEVRQMWRPLAPCWVRVPVGRQWGSQRTQVFYFLLLLTWWKWECLASCW